MDPIHQFEIKNLLPIARIGGIEIALTNSALFMMIALAGFRTLRGEIARLQYGQDIAGMHGTIG